MTDLFGNNIEIIRTLGFYQPFCSLMLPPYDKVETRWVRVGRKVPFVMGKYLFYSTKKPCGTEDFYNWCGNELVNLINTLLSNEDTVKLDGYAIAIAQLRKIDLMTKNDEKRCFVECVGSWYRKDKNGTEHEYKQVCLFFEDVQRIEPFEFNFGKQGIGHLPLSEYEKIKIL